MAAIIHLPIPISVDVYLYQKAIEDQRTGLITTVLFADDVDIDAVDPVSAPDSPFVILIAPSPAPIDKPPTPPATKMRQNKRLKRRIKKIRAIERERRKRMNEE